MSWPRSNRTEAHAKGFSGIGAPNSPEVLSVLATEQLSHLYYS
jgi:hypothetical protein